MEKQAELQTLLEELLGSRNVYYEPPAGLLMKYPAIRYSLSDIDTKYADNLSYSNRNRYELIIIDYLPDNKVVQKILDLPLSSFDRRYNQDGLVHDVITLYY
jgi:hypothetical protein